MPSDEYASAGAGGALRLKGAKVEKHKKKHKHKKKKLEAALEKGLMDDRADKADADKDRDEPADQTEDPFAHMTPTERRFAEAQERKFQDLLLASPEEARASHPELFKSHKERLADLNAYLSRMSEHHDMPKIGPG
ncbi:duf1754 domain containing protein [Grosmannia clavigera kw1407]|uniref:Duf1754 domain containing protein n=1 Tax=Grosmannia clavigera (strain kw1407 / UAMH 11150) TaxID=655863 RepID=F0XEM8_GROCL|nr:duf1754 domain containing protein [Grosmannia clavigera kw1407]EFX04076.1 duf1754 domain containing protein [Grosmannia clavigera kw1407]